MASTVSVRAITPPKALVGSQAKASANAAAGCKLTSAAFSQAWLDIEAGRPWRSGFAQAARTLGPHPVPLAVGLWIAVQELAAPVAVVLATAIMVGIVGA